ncbi:MAG: hypothetical protein ACREDR_03025 [Blastocatellia bacterium]
MFSKVNSPFLIFSRCLARQIRASNPRQISFVVGIIILVGFGTSASATAAQRDRYNHARAVVSRLQEDLRHAEGTASQHKHSKDAERIDHAMRHLSDFDRSLSKGKFDSGRLDRAVSDVQNIVDHNTLSPEDRDNLMSDLHDMRSMRSDRGR